MTREILVTDFEDFVCQLYGAIKEAAERGDGLQFELSPYDCLKWSKSTLPICLLTESKAKEQGE